MGQQFSPCLLVVPVQGLQFGKVIGIQSPHDFLNGQQELAV
jgi:hypothetical protein